MNQTYKQLVSSLYAALDERHATRHLRAGICVTLLAGLTAFGANAADDLSRLGSVVSAKIQLPKTSSVTVSLDDPDVKRNADSDWALFKNAIAKLKSVHATRLVIPKRVYSVKADAGISLNDAVINLNDLNDVSIEGNGAELDFQDINVHAGIRIGHSNRIAIQGLIIDWTPTLAYPGTLVHEGTTNIFVVDKAFPIDVDSIPAFTTLFQFDLQKRRHLEANQPWYDRMLGCPQNPARCAKYLGQQRFELPRDGAIDALPPNSTMVATLRSNNLGALIVDNGSSDITLRDVTVYGSPGVALSVINAGGGFHLQKVVVTRKPDNLLSNGEQPRLISVAADAINFISTQGNILIEDSEVAYEADDGINIRGRMSEARPFQDNPQTLELTQADPSAFVAGDALDIRNEGTMAFVAKSHIRSVQKSPSGTFVVTLDSKPDIAPGTKLFVVSERLSSGNYVIRNCNFHDNKNRGILLRGGPGLVVNNKVSGTTSSGIQLGAEFSGNFAEGPPIHDVLVTQNTVSDTNRGDYAVNLGSQKYPAAIMAYVTDNHSYQGPENENLRIEDNTVSHVPGMGIFIASSLNATVSNNTLQDINLKSYGDSKMTDVAIYVTQSAKISVERNRISAGRVSVDQSTTSAVEAR
jgi:parallel beta-helix repeat protein